MHDGFIIDKITNSIEEVKTGKKFDTDVLPMKPEDFLKVNPNKRWHFDWQSESEASDHYLYKLVIRGKKTIQGVISIQDFGNYFELHLIETAPHNFGKEKKYEGVLGNLVAYSCKRSYENGNDDCFVTFVAKTRLINHYRKKIGAKIETGNRMKVFGKSAIKLVNSYYKNLINEKKASIRGTR
ncbi:MAG: hypothetical protein ABI581_05670 [Sediminibacterium sp.]